MRHSLEAQSAPNYRLKMTDVAELCRFRGYLDPPDGSRVQGWAVDLEQGRATVEIVIDGKLACECAAHSFRLGAPRDNSLPSQTCGFTVDVSQHAGKLVVARIKNTNYILPGSPRAINALAKNPSIGIAAIVKDEAPYLLEWIAFHRALGIQTFIIADNCSTDGTSELLASLSKDCSFIHSFLFPTIADRAPQMPAYSTIWSEYASHIDYLAFIDADEFITPTSKSFDFPSFLAVISAADNFGALLLNWAIYGSSTLTHHGADPVITRFNCRAIKSFRENHHYKSVVKTSAFASLAGTPHHFRLLPNHACYKTSGLPLTEFHERGPGLSPSIDWINFRLNHYAVKSRSEYFEKKAPRGRADIIGGRGEQYFLNHDRNERYEPLFSLSSDELQDAFRKELSEITYIARHYAPS